MGIWNNNEEDEFDKGLDGTSNKPITEISELESDLMERWGSVQSALSAGSKVDGKLIFDKPVRFDGILKGEVNAPEALVVIGPDGVVDAKIEAAFLVVMGTVKGSLHASEKIEILSTGNVSGDLKAPRIVMQDGCVFNGTCSMETAQLHLDANRDLKIENKFEKKETDTVQKESAAFEKTTNRRVY